jgi:hypothetical protein
VARLSDDELSSGESAALECSGEPDPDLIPIATFDPTGNSIAHDRGTGDSSRNGVRGCDVNVGKRGEAVGPKAKRSRFGKETKSDKRQKVLIETETLAILVCSYNHHLSDYCKGRRHVTQRIPSKVWRIYGIPREGSRVRRRKWRGFQRKAASGGTNVARLTTKRTR